MCANQYEIMKQSLMSCVQSQISNLKDVDAKELGEAIDMLKDIEEAMYYCTITEAMKNKEDESVKEYYYYLQPRYNERERDMDREWGRMYYGGSRSDSSSSYGRNNNNDSNRSGNGGRYDIEPDQMMRDPREGRSHQTRKTYMESKEMHRDKASQLKELEKYMQELTQDMVEMIEDASPEEKQYLEKRVSALASKIGQVK